MRGLRNFALAASAALTVAAGSFGHALATTDPAAGLPAGSRGHRSYMSNLGNLAFNSPGSSTPSMTIPSLRGARFLAPYGHDGRTASLRDFVRNVVVNEFSGTEPSAEILDAMVVYIEDIDFLPNPKLDATGHLGAAATPSQKRGETLFRKPFPHDPALSCAACHLPSEAFVDHRQHDIGSGGLFKTPTLLNAKFAAPYFHDGRFDNFAQVIEHFNRVYGLGLSAQEAADLADYLAAVGDGVRPDYRLTGNNVLADIAGFTSVLDIAISQRDKEVITLATKSGQDLLRDLADHYSESTQDSNSAGLHQRALDSRPP